jgi:acyl transferase domain-containing protein
MNESPSEPSPNSVAIIGMAGRWPGARSVSEFWINMKEGKDCITRFTEAELEDNFAQQVRSAENFVRARPILEHPDKFDASFFGVLPREAALMDPQHRIFLECAWETIEDAGYDHSRYGGSIGVFAGCSMPTYFLRHVLQDRNSIDSFTSNYQVGMFQHLTGALTDALATRVAYKLNLTGPAATVHTACSTSLFAVAQAWQSLLLYQCDMAVAGGVSITFPQRRGHQHLEGGMVSADGHCRPFDANASGTLFGDGAGAILLKRLGDAIADGDRIYAVLKGCGINNDGSNKVGFTAPSAHGQAGAIAAAHAIADTDPATIAYVECHGTATPLGDPIEFEGLLKAFGAEAGKGYCAIGSAKANIGHLDAAAGVSGLIRATLALHHNEIPPLLNFSKPNPRIDLDDSPFYVPTDATPWHRTGHPRRAGVSSFGVGGTNVHVVLEEAPVTRRVVGGAVSPQLLLLSAKTDAALERQKNALAACLGSKDAPDLADAAFTLQVGRRAFERRGAIVASSNEEAVAKLSSRISISSATERAPNVVFMFPGQGAQYPAMAAGLYDALADFREEIDRGAEVLKSYIGEDVREILFNAPDHEDASHPIRSTLIAQPALFLIEHAVAKQWMRFGIKPAAMIGHSVGEFVAAAIAGVMSYQDALRLIAARGRLMQSMPLGAMLAVRLSEGELEPLLDGTADIAAVNAPSLCVVAGTYAAIEELESRLSASNVQHRRLHTSHAFHSRMMDPIIADLRKEAATIRLAPPQLPYMSCVTGGWISSVDATQPDYWARHCRASVRFADGLAAACKGSTPVLLEVGPGRTLATLASQILPQAGYACVANSLPDFGREQDDLAHMLQAAGKLWSSGVASFDWDAVGGSGRSRVSLPPYQFEPERHWIDAAPSAAPVVPDRSSPHRFTSTELNSAISKFRQEEPVMRSVDQSCISQLVPSIVDILETLSGSDLADADPNANFLELGFDSLFLGQVAIQIQNKFRVKVTFRQLLNDIPSVAALAEHLEKEMPSDALPTAFPPPLAAGLAAPAPVSAMPLVTSENASGLAGIFQAQIAAMQNLIAQQNQLLLNAGNANPVAPVATTGQTNASPASPTVTPTHASEADDKGTSQPQRFRMFNPKTAKQSKEIPTKQLAFIKDLTAKYNAKTAKSKAYTDANRPHLADPRAAAGFRTEWKELCYPIVASHSKGSKIWDLDGNEYVDLVNGYGQTAFGHAPDFVRKAVAEQLEKGFAIGPQSDLVGEVSRRIGAMVGMDRVTFCVTGSEAVMAAMRVARAVTGREKVVVFNNDYHGQFDEVLVKAGGRASTPRALPLASGIPFGSVSNMIVLPYGAPESLEWVRANASDLAAVVVEPVQSRHPELRPFEFLRELRKITEAAETGFVFD